MSSVFDFRDYRDYLIALSQIKGARSGFKSGLARAAACNNAYISSVLGGRANLSLEQAERISHFLELPPEENHYFLLLVQRTRAGTRPLIAYFDRQIDRLLEEKLNVQRRLGVREELSTQDQAQYYSSWMYAAVHVALAVPRLGRSPEALARYLDISLAQVKMILDFLVRTGLAKLAGSQYTVGPRHIHLGKTSHFVGRHHTNWRLCAIRAIEENRDQNLNYSSAVALSRDDAFKIREILLSAVKSSVDVIMDSPEEEAYVLNVDFVPLGHARAID